MQPHSQHSSPAINRRNWMRKNADDQSDAPSDECTISHQNIRSFDEKDENSHSIIKDLNALKNVIDARYHK